MDKEIYFIAGIYGVGKTTLCNKLSKILKIPHFSASKLISECNGEKYGPNKSVKNYNQNQNILIEQLKIQLNRWDRIILNGHFVILNNGQILKTPKEIFIKLPISKIILLESEIDIIINNLINRDNKIYSKEIIKKLQYTECMSGKKIAENLNLDFMIHKMLYSNMDENLLSNWIRGDKL